MEHSEDIKYLKGVIEDAQTLIECATKHLAKLAVHDSFAEIDIVHIAEIAQEIEDRAEKFLSWREEQYGVFFNALAVARWIGYNIPSSPFYDKDLRWRIETRLRREWWNDNRKDGLDWKNYMENGAKEVSDWYSNRDKRKSDE